MTNTLAGQAPDRGNPPEPANEPPAWKRLRVWPGVIIVAVQWLVRFGLPVVAPAAAGVAILGGVAGGLLILVWWLLFSRARWSERLGALGLIVLALPAASRVVHPSIANGMMGMMLPICVLPLLSLALVGWALACGRLPIGLHRVTLLGAILIACGVMTLVRTGGMTGDAASEFHWRWTQTPEQELLAQAAGRPLVAPSAPAAGGQAPAGLPPVPAADTTPDAGWPGFRGVARDSVITGIQIATNWSHSPPVELWRQPVGPGWSSFAVGGGFVFTQEQLGDDELVSCYNLATGAPVWKHADAARFWESNGGAGPRGTPTLSNGRVYTFGATGILNALDPRNGSVLWSRNAASDTGAKTPGWGFSSSPLVVGDTVIIATAGVLAAYEIATGTPRWVGPTGGWGYSSPQLATLDGVPQILLLNGTGAISVSPTDGKLLWDHSWKSDGIVQPAVLTGGEILLGSGSGLGGKVGVRRVAVTRAPAGWTVAERWTSIGLKPYFSDFVVHKDHAYGFDGGRLACLDLTNGERRWKGERYGHGQLVELRDQDLLLVLSEQGELALVRSNPDQFAEIARFAAIKGKTWNHPVLAGEVLLVRNDRQMAAFRLARADR